MRNKKGNVALSVLVGFLALSGLIMIAQLSMNEKFNNVQNTNRITSRYLGESAIEVQKYLLHNKMDNKVIKIYFKEGTDTSGNDIRQYYKGETIFTPQEVHTGGITDINSAVSRILEESVRYGSIRDIHTNIKLEDPNMAEDTGLDYLCDTGKFFIESPNDTFKNLKCSLKDMHFTTDIEYIGGRIVAKIKVSGVEVIRESYYSVGDSDMMGTHGEVISRLNTENMRIELESFQNYRGGL